MSFNCGYVLTACVVPLCINIFTSADRALSEFADLLVEECGSKLDSLDTCVAEVTLRELDNACLCVNAKELSESLNTKMRNSVMPAMVHEQLHPSKEAYPNSPSRTGHPLRTVTDNSEVRQGCLCAWINICSMKASSIVISSCICV